MESNMKSLSVCNKCGVHRKDRTRDFFGLWFVDLDKREGWCPVCAGNTAKKFTQWGEEAHWVSIPFQAV